MYEKRIEYKGNDYQMRLRVPEDDDVERMWALKQESWLTTHSVNIMTLDTQRKWWEHAQSDPNSRFLIAEHYDLRSNRWSNVGLYVSSNIDWMNRTCVQSHHVWYSQRGKGYSYPVMVIGCHFVFDVLNLRRIDAEVLTNNPASLRTALRAGFVEEGVRRNAVERMGETFDSTVIGLLRGELAS